GRWMPRGDRRGIRPQDGRLDGQTCAELAAALIRALHTEERLQARHDAGQAGLLDGLDDEVDGLVGLWRLVDHRTDLLIEAHVAERAQHLRVGEGLLGLGTAELAPRAVVDAVFTYLTAGQAHQDVAGHAHGARDQHGV